MDLAARYLQRSRSYQGEIVCLTLEDFHGGGIIARVPPVLLLVNHSCVGGPYELIRLSSDTVYMIFFPLYQFLLGAYDCRSTVCDAPEKRQWLVLLRTND